MDANKASHPRPPAWMRALDGSEWAYYVHGHDEGELAVVDDPAALTFERLWMRPIRASQATDYGLSYDGETEPERGPDGRFQPRWLWLECDANAVGAEPYMGTHYADARTTT